MSNTDPSPGQRAEPPKTEAIENAGDAPTKTVGVYDRPANADAPNKLRLIVMVIAVIIGGLVMYWYLR